MKNDISPLFCGRSLQRPCHGEVDLNITTFQGVNLFEGYYSCRRFRHEALSSDYGDEQAAPARV